VVYIISDTYSLNDVRTRLCYQQIYKYSFYKIKKTLPLQTITEIKVQTLPLQTITEIKVPFYNYIFNAYAEYNLWAIIYQTYFIESVALQLQLINSYRLIAIERTESIV